MNTFSPISHQVLIHPAIDEVKLGRLTPQPNINIDELEFSVNNHSQVLELRSALIHNRNGRMKYQAYIKSEKDFRVRKDLMYYHYGRSKVSSMKYYAYIKSEKDFREGKDLMYYHNGRSKVSSMKY